MLLLVAMAGSILAQVSSDHYAALKYALGLSDSQLAQIQVLHLQERNAAEAAGNQRSPGIYSAARQAGDFAGANSVSKSRKEAVDSLRNQVLNDWQRAKLSVTEKVLDQSEIASQAIVLGLMTTEQWPGGSLCYYPIRNQSGLGLSLSLSPAQVLQFGDLQKAVGQASLC